MKTSEKTKSWSEIRAEIKNKFSKISDESLDSLNENFDHLSEKLQYAYGMAKNKADREIDQLKRSFHRGTAEMRSDASKTVTKAKATVKLAKDNAKETVSSARN
jgi:uncharacterized protein YjbJ (UPF0337 family)